MYVGNIKDYLLNLGYNHLRMTFFPTAKYTTLEKIFEAAKEIINTALPIQCLEATFVAMYLCFGIPDLICFPLGFKSKSSSKSHKFEENFYFFHQKVINFYIYTHLHIFH